MTIVRAIDVGYNGTKFTKAINENGEIQFDVFPSLAPQPNSLDLEGFDDDLFAERNTVKVTVNDMQFEVGPDVREIETSGESRMLHDQFPSSDQYKALAYGALFYMDVDSIDLLVLGLPVNNGKKYSADLKKFFTGEHEITEGRRVVVKNVLVVPQAYGGYKAFEQWSKTQTDKQVLTDDEEVTLVIDPGYFTFDFVCVQGREIPKLLSSRSGSKEGGIHQILSSICNSITKNTLGGIKYEDYDAIDTALRRNKREVRISGEQEDLTLHIKNTTAAIESVVDYMKNIAGDGVKKNIDNINIIGGNPNIFLRTIKEKFPTIAEKGRIFINGDSIFANAEGFYLYGVSKAEKMGLSSQTPA